MAAPALPGVASPGVAGGARARLERPPCPAAYGTLAAHTAR